MPLMNTHPLNTKRPAKVVCVGRNYADHAAELSNQVPSEPVLFIKPGSAIAAGSQIPLDEITKDSALGQLHFECEFCLRIGRSVTDVASDQALGAIDAVTLGLDLTLRGVQDALKVKGLPWERAKAFDGSCLLGDWLSITEADLAYAEFECWINGERRQHGISDKMLFGFHKLVSEISAVFTLEAGDVVMTGTPSGVGALNRGDLLELKLIEPQGLAVQQFKVV